jgi:hypothetical protein
MHFQTPRKPAESRIFLAAEILRQATMLKWTDAELLTHLMAFFTDVDLKLILDEMRSRT